MCGRYTLSRGEKVIQAIPNITIREDLRRMLERGRFNIAPAQDVLVAVQTGAGPELRVMQWGLIPSWGRDASSRLINARAETLARKPAFRGALRSRRCAIPADGFYEWRTGPDGRKTPVYIRLKSHGGFAFAGLWETWKDPTGETLMTCTIITTAPNALLAPIHDRMPAILAPEAVQRWLGGTAAQGDDDLSALLHPFPADPMELFVVSRAVNSATHEGAELIEPVDEAAPAQGGKPPAASRGRRTKADPPGQGKLF